MRFWALNTSVYGKKSADLDRHAKFLAKRGCNMVRCHGNMTLRDREHRRASIRTERDQLWHLRGRDEEAGHLHNLLALLGDVVSALTRDG